MNVELVSITPANLDALCKLDAGDGGVQVAPNQRSMAQAACTPEAWPRGISVDGELVGFLMLWDPSLNPAGSAEPDFSLWRFMIDKSRQRRGHGAAAIRLLLESLRGRTPALYLSYVPGPTSPEAFYRALGFEATGDEIEGEVLMVYKY